MMNDATDRPRDLYGLVLAGGRSRRFGSDKAAIEVDGQSLLERTADLLRPVVRRVYVSATENQSEDPLRGAFALILDEEPGLGPAGGLRAAHRLHPEAAWLVVACDMPALDERVVARLVQSRGPEKAGSTATCG
jgi:molybdopterin-guanine dinucleotide biosynthesis protein A